MKRSFFIYLFELYKKLTFTRRIFFGRNSKRFACKNIIYYIIFGGEGSLGAPFKTLKFKTAVKILAVTQEVD